MRPDIAFLENLASPSCPAGFLTVDLPNRVAEQARKRWRGDETFASRFRRFCDYELMIRLPRFLMPLVAGCVITILQVLMAVALLAPEEPVTERYSALVQHDSYWFMNIIDRGYQTIVPPIDHKVLEVSNVAFFPAYPAIAGILHYGARLGIYDALLVTAQAAAWAFWSYFFLFCRRWNFLARAAVHRLREELSHLRQHGQHLDLVEQTLRRLHVHELMDASGDFVQRIHPQSKLHSLCRAELIDQDFRARLPFDGFKEQGRPSGLRIAFE